MHLQRDLGQMWTFLVSLFIFCTIFIPTGKVYGSLETPHGKGHLETCSEKEPCQSIKWLNCQNGFCLCTEPDEIMYDDESEKCSALAGYSCLRSYPDSQPNDNSSRYYISCVPHAKCSYPEDECQCEFRYYKAENNTCLRQMGYGSSCGRDEECDQFQFLSCIGGTCQCDAKHRYDAKNEKCYVPIGNSCKVIDFMSISEESYVSDECPENGSCKDGVCSCDEGFKICSDKTCGKDYGDSCNADEKCSDISYTCRNQVCACKFPLHQYYDENTNQCVSLVTGPCSMQTESKQSNSGLNVTQACTENAACHETPAYTYCKCKEGFVENNEGRCVKAYGMKCQYDQECDSLPPLACVENVCSCQDKLQAYDDKQRKCIGLAGARCWKDANSTMNVCTANAVCVKTNHQLNYGKCVCVRSTLATASRTCVKN